MRRFFILILVSAFTFINAQVENGLATWYGKALHGNKTASGVRFDMNGMTCAADKKFKFGTKLKVTNKKNGKSVIVTVTDRGNSIKGNKIDLSSGAFGKIANLRDGIIKIIIEVVK